MELQQYWQKYEYELEICQKYITNIVSPFLQSTVENIAEKDIATEQKMAQVICYIIVHANVDEH